MQNILIIKTGAAGDVVRTTTLLNILNGSITWVVEQKNKLIFPDRFPGLRLITNLDSAYEELKSEQFELILSLEEDEACAKLASSIKSNKLEGVSLNHEGLAYSDQASGWFDMSLISRKGREKANLLKRSNPYSFQHLLFSMIGREFKNEPYQIYRDPSVKKIRGLIGIETRSGTTWPGKAWNGYDELIRLLEKDGYTIRRFTQKENIRDYFNDIAGCSCVICGDSLPMHVALAYQIHCVGIFNCTPPTEIHDYGFLTKIVSPLLEKNLYSRQYNKELLNSIPVAEVYAAFTRLALPK